MSGQARGLTPGTTTASTATDQSVQPAEESTRPRAVDVIGGDAWHALIAAGYTVVGVCRSCGSPLTNPTSVRAQYGPVCGGRVIRRG